MNNFEGNGENNEIPEKWKVDLEELEALARESLPNEVDPGSLKEQLDAEALTLLSDMMAAQGELKYLAAKAKETEDYPKYFDDVIAAQKNYFDLQWRWRGIRGMKEAELLGKTMIKKITKDPVYKEKIFRSALGGIHTGQQDAVEHTAALLVELVTTAKKNEGLGIDWAKGGYSGALAKARAFAKIASKNGDIQIAKKILEILVAKHGDTLSVDELNKLSPDSQ